MTNRYSAAFLAAVIILAGCSGTPSSASETAAPQVTAESAVETAAADKTAVPQASSETEGLTEEKAVEIALSDAGLTASDAVFTKKAKERDDGVVVYDLEFYGNDMEYDYEINATTGEIVSRSSEKHPRAQSSAGAEDITEQKALSIALAHAGAAESDISHKKIEADLENGHKVYDIEFIYGSREYSYEIDASSGEILEYDMDD